MRLRQIGAGRALAAGFFMFAGVMHFMAPDDYVRIVPRWVPDPELMVLLSGIAEIAGGAGLLAARTRRIAGAGLILLLVAVFPANIEMLRQHRESGGSLVGELLLWGRLPLQLLIMYWVARVSLFRRARDP